MALNTVGSERLATNVKTSNLGTELSKKVGQSKNLIINGAMQVAQRGTSSTSSGYRTIDRYTNDFGGIDENPTYEQVDVASGTTPYTLGFRKSAKITNGNQTSGAGTQDLVVIFYSFEARDIANSGWNYTSASSFMTLSFWINSSVAQNFYGRFYTYDGTAQGYAFETGSLTAGEWKKVTKTIPGNSNLTFDNNVNAGLLIEISAFRGTGGTASMSLNQWAAYNSNSRTPDQTSTWYTTNDATLEVTGLQLEVGSQATPFEHRSFGEDLVLCQRYFQVLGGSNGTYDSMATGSCASSTVAYVPHRLVATMRSTPSFTLVGSASDFRYTKGADQTPSGLTLDQAGANMVAVRVSAASDHLGTDDAIRLFNVNTTGAFQFSSEI